MKIDNKIENFTISCGRAAGKERISLLRIFALFMIFLSLLFALSFTEAKADTQNSAMAIWAGKGGDGKWSNPLNWASGAIPGPNDNVIINGGDNITWDAPDQIKSLSVELYTFGIFNVLGEKTTTNNLWLLTSQGRVNGGVLNVGGNITVGNNLKGGTVTLNINGSDNQTISNHTKDGNLPGITIDKLSGMLIIPERTKVGGDWNFKKGALAGFGTLVLTLYDTKFIPGDASYYNVTVMKNAFFDLDILGTGRIVNDLFLISPSGKISGGTLNVGGSLVVSGYFDKKNSTTIIKKTNSFSANLEKFNFLGNIFKVFEWFYNIF